MDFKQLQYILKIAEMGNLTKAANELHMTQPALSHFITKVEEEEGLKLFDRSASPIVLTYGGERYVEAIRKILAINRQLQDEMYEIASWKQGRLTVGIPPVRSAYKLPRVIHEYSRKFPGVEIRIIEHNSNRLREDVISGRVDFAVTPMAEDYGECECLHLYDEEIFLISREGLLPEWTFHYNSLGEKVVELDKLKQERFVMLKRGQEFRIVLNNLFKRYGCFPRNIMEMINNETCFAMAAEGLGLTIVPRMNIELMKITVPIDVYKLSDKGEFWPVCVLYLNKGKEKNRLAAQFIDMLWENMNK